MILIRKVHIEEFRGIRELDLELGAKSFGICGPNGSGKSGIVDAIEFCLTGDVTRLSGQGSSNLSVKAHAPHVDHKKKPENSKVTITVDIPSLKKIVTISRSVKNANTIIVDPKDKEVINIIEDLQRHPEFALSRREIIKYIITPPGQRAKDVQTLLRLDHLEKIRKSLTTFANKRKSEAEQAGRAYASDEAEFRSGLGLEKLDREAVLAKVNDYRAILDLPPISELKPDTSFKEGVAVAPEKKKQPVVKATALNDITTLSSAINSGEPDDLLKSKTSARSLLEKLKEDKDALALAKRHGFIRTGLSLVTEDACPLCDTEWKAEELREYLQSKIQNAESFQKLIGELRASINTILQHLALRKRAVETVIGICRKLEPVVDHKELDGCVGSIGQMESALNEFLNDHSKVEPAIQALDVVWWKPDDTKLKEIESCETSVKALPDASAADKARDVLTVAHDRYMRLLNASKAKKTREKENKIAQAILSEYNTSCTEVLEQIYDKVALDFSKYYRIINHEDEHGFESKLTSIPAKLNFDVDFYGRGLFPPGAYHSEGHQDGMGLCLYLALMKHTFGDKFTFAVFDDVLMSVDTGHRRDVCRLLKAEFPNTQFILTTHDRIWLQYMKTENLIASSQIFAGWSVETGPRVWSDQDVWGEIQGELDKNNIEKASSVLRRYLEFISNLLANNFHAAVQFKSDGRYMLGDLMPPTLKAWVKNLEKGAKAAGSWGKSELQNELKTRITEVREAIAKSRAEEWAINPSVHYNEWENFDKAEFQSVVDSFRSLLSMLMCVGCKTFIYLSPPAGQPEILKCNCGDVSINLKDK